jgi:predicted dehydrogenase
LASPNRRDFLKIAAASGAAVSMIPSLGWGQTTQPRRVVVALMGSGPRGTTVASAFASLPGVVVKYVCDVDETRSAAAAKKVAAKAEANGGSPGPTPLQDFRKALDDAEVDVLAVAGPNHWHAPAAILACAAGKHAYVEKPCSHNPREGELLVEAARKYGRCVQHGTQRRSWPKVVEAIAKVREGAIGNVHFSRGWYANNRGSIGRGKPGTPPGNLDWSFWQGPAPEREFRDNYAHYNWHWFWQWGNGECGNNGIHSLDLCRWGLGVDVPTKVTSAGGRYHFQDDQETPDTQFVTYEFGDKVIHWEGRSCQPRPVEGGGSTHGAAFYGDKGSLIIDRAGYVVYDLKNKEVSKVEGPSDDAGAQHLQNFVDAVRAGDPTKLNAPIAEGAASTLLCHLGNISQRTGRTVHVDAGKIVGDNEAAHLWTREYRKGWEPKV